MIVFDCSVDLNQIINQNKLVYWFNFLEKQVEIENKVLLVATKFDLLQKQFSNIFGFIDQKKLIERLLRIHNGIKQKLFLSYH